MIKKLKKGLNRRKVRIFFTFFLCASLAWLLNNLSEAHTSNAAFSLEFKKAPDSLLLISVSKKTIDTKLRTSGFQFFNFGFNKKKIQIDMSFIEHKGGVYFVSQRIYKRQIEKQMSNSIELLSLDNDTIFFDFQKVYTKEVPIVSMLNVTMAQNHLIEGELSIKPSTVIVKGPLNEIETINTIRTSDKKITDVSSNFSHDLALIKPQGLRNTEFSISTVNISAEVSKFSEKIIEIPIEVIHLPEGMKMQTFPNSISILCKGKLDKLIGLLASDFTLIVDYEDVNGNLVSKLPLQLVKIPEGIYDALLMETNVEYIIRKE